MISGGILAVIIIVAVAGGATKDAGSSPGEGSEKTAAVDNEAPAYTPQEVTYVTPSATDFTLTIKTLTKQCFGSAGCNVTFRVSVGYSGSLADLDPSESYELTYEVRGGEDGPQINTLTIEGDSFVTDEEEYISTRSSKSKLTVRVLSIE